MSILSLLIIAPALTVLINFIGFLIGKHLVNNILSKIMEPISLLFLPFLYIDFSGFKNDCCDDSAIFSPEHQLSIWVVILCCLLAYFYSSYRKTIASPVVEILVNAFLIIGIILNIFIALHANEALFIVSGNVPIILLFILVLEKNQNIFMAYAQGMESGKRNVLESICWKILTLNPILKFPVIFILCLPVLIIVSAILLLVGQKPDSLVRAFTETYHHGLSQWNYKCDNVQCGGHYLCSVAANGHKKIVKPQRLGIRNGHLIICNRQLLVSNAFEEFIQEKMPVLHKMIRKQYNKVGHIVHRYYGIFNNKIVSDIIYFLMKPLEWFFILILYIFDRNPENRIAMQYLSKRDRRLCDTRQ